MFKTSTKTVPESSLPQSLTLILGLPHPFSFLEIVLLSYPTYNGQPHEASDQSSFSSLSFHVQAPGLVFLWQESS